MNTQKIICGALLSMAIICAVIMCLVNPETNNFVGNITDSFINNIIHTHDIHWFIQILLILIICAVAAAAVILTIEDSIIPVASYIICCVAGLITAGVVAINFFFEQNIVISPTVAMWINLISFAAMLIAIIYATFFCKYYAWWKIIVIAIGEIAAILAGAIACTLIMLILSLIWGIVLIIIFIVIVIAMFASMGR